VVREKINILLADDHAILRDGIKMLLSAEKDLNVVGEAKNGDEAIQIARKLKPDIVLMDISMPSINGLEAAKQILRFVDTKIILLSMYTDEEYVVQAIRIGVSGYLHKQSAATSLLKAVRAVKNGEAYFSSSISKTVLETARKNIHKQLDFSRFDSLTKREKQILQMISEGTSSREIGNQLFISMPTVYKHRRNLMKKIGVFDAVGLTRFAIKNKLIAE